MRGVKGATVCAELVPQVMTESNLSSVEKILDWLLNCVPSGILEGYEMLGAGSVIGLDVLSTLLVRGDAKVIIMPREIEK